MSVFAKSFTPLFNSLISIFSGLWGYRFALGGGNSSDLSAYINASLIAAVIQVFLLTITTQRKDEFSAKKYLNSSNYIPHIATSKFLSILLIIVFLLTFLFTREPTWMMLSLFMFITLFESSTFIQSSYFFISNNQKYWRYVVLGNLTKLISVVIFVATFNLSFIGLILSTLMASIVSCICYSVNQLMVTYYF